MCQAFVGLPQGAQAAGPRQQAVLHPGQEDGARVRLREDQGIQHVQVPQGSSLQPIRISTYTSLDYTVRIHTFLSQKFKIEPQFFFTLFESPGF